MGVGGSPAVLQRRAGKANSRAEECQKGPFCMSPFLIRTWNPAKIGLNRCPRPRRHGEPQPLALALLLPGSTPI